MNKINYIILKFVKDDIFIEYVQCFYLWSVQVVALIHIERHCRGHGKITLILTDTRLGPSRRRRRRCLHILYSSLIFYNVIPDIRRHRRCGRRRQIVLMKARSGGKFPRAFGELDHRRSRCVQTVLRSIKGLCILGGAQNVVLHVVNHWRRASYALYEIRRDKFVREFVIRWWDPVSFDVIQRLVESRQIESVRWSRARLTRQRRCKWRGVCVNSVRRRDICATINVDYF